MKNGVLIVLMICSCQLFSQENKRQYRQNQHKLDQNYGGIGPTFTRPNLGRGVLVPNRWYGANVQTDFVEFEFIVGETQKIQPITKKDEFQFPIADYGNDFGYLITGGVNFPLPILTFGAYQNPVRIFRGHPTLGTNLGYGAFKKADQLSGKTKLFYWGIKVGYRLRLPAASVEFNLNARLGWSSVDDFAGTGFDFYRGSGISPSVTLRFDAFKGIFNPRMVSMSVQQVSVTNVKSETERTGSRYVGNTRYETYTRTTTGDVNVTSGNAGIQDIGPHLGVGPKVSFMNPIRSNYIKPSFLVGVVAEGRASVADFGLTLEGGRVGHGSVLEFKGEGEPRRKLNKKKSDPIGMVNTVNLYANIGIDISPAFLVPFGIVIDKGESTSFFSATAGFNIGAHGAFGQQYNNSSTAVEFETLAQTDNEFNLKEKYLNPAKTGVGLLGGFYFSVQVGAASFKVTNYRYYGAPFASTTMMSIAWRIPVIYDL